MKKINFNQDWEFCLNDGKDLDESLTSEFMVDLPHDFSIIQKRSKDAPSGASGGFFQCGVGKYKKHFKAKKNKKYFFLCDGSFGLTEVFVNSKIAYINKYGYNSFYVDMTEHLRYDKENEILIRVNNKAQPNARWYAGSGIYRDTFLCECDGAYIDPYGPFVYTKALTDNKAYLCVELFFYADKKGEGVVEFEVFEEGKKAPVCKLEKYIIATEGQNKLLHNFDLTNYKLWDLDNPNMYQIKATLILDGKKDTETAPFGIRTIAYDCENGLLINGKAVKLRGGCIHHDQGALGSAVYPETEYRRVAKLKEAGFNSVRLSHNPQSPYLYDACDRLGMLVIDELFDYWTEGKKEDDSHAYFEQSYESWIELIVRRNRCHPSIVMWSTGNEIPQKTGRGNGYVIARNIADNIRKLDTSRPLTHALCSLWDNSEEYEIELKEQSFPAEEIDYFARKTAITADTVDIVGYNYLEYRLEKDLIRFPNRLFVNTETFPISAYQTIKQQLNNPRILGDYVWTAWDYFGETGIGHVEYNEKRGDFALDYPYHIANCGDIDIIGERKPQSYYREIAWGLRRDPYVAVRHPKLFTTPYFISGWGFYECEDSWHFDGYEGKETEVYVFADCDEVVLYVNDKEVGRQAKTTDGVYKFTAKYQEGRIMARALVNGKEIGKHTLYTEGKAEKLTLTKEKSYIPKGMKLPKWEIVYVDAIATDKNGSRATHEDREVSYIAEGAKILGVASGELQTEEMYNSSTHRLYNGRSLIAIKKQRGSAATLKAVANGLVSAEIEI